MKEVSRFRRLYSAGGMGWVVGTCRVCGNEVTSAEVYLDNTCRVCGNEVTSAEVYLDAPDGAVYVCDKCHPAWKQAEGGETIPIEDIVVFEAGRDGDAIGRYPGVDEHNRPRVFVAIPNGGRPGPGEAWDVELLGYNPERTVVFVKPVRKVGSGRITRSVAHPIAGAGEEVVKIGHAYADNRAGVTAYWYAVIKREE